MHTAASFTSFSSFLDFIKNPRRDLLRGLNRMWPVICQNNLTQLQTLESFDHLSRLLDAAGDAAEMDSGHEP